MVVLASHRQHLQPLDLNLGPPDPNPNSPQANTQNLPTHLTHETEHPSSYGFFSHMGLPSWAQWSFRALGICLPGQGVEGPNIPTPTVDHPIHPLTEQTHYPPNTLEGLVTHNWAGRRVLGPNEAGPSNWHQMDAANIIPPREPLECDDTMVDSDPEELLHIASMIHSRFRLSPPLLAYPFNPGLQVQVPYEIHGPSPNSERLYSPTSPLQLSDVYSSSSEEFTTQLERQIVLGLPCSLPPFGEKNRRDGKLSRTRSMNRRLQYEDDLSQYKARKKKQRLEAWDAKGGFTLWDTNAPPDYKAKAITDVSLANVWVWR